MKSSMMCHRGGVYHKVRAASEQHGRGWIHTVRKDKRRQEMAARKKGEKTDQEMQRDSGQAREYEDSGHHL